MTTNLALIVRATLISMVVLGVYATASEVLASSCNGNGTTKRIVFKKGAVCWKYKGTASYFTGTFSRGQDITVHMTGVAEYLGKNGKTTSAIEPRSPFTLGPSDFYADDIEGAGFLRFTAPQSGKYFFSFSPCAMQGNMGDVTICAQ